MSDQPSTPPTSGGSSAWPWAVAALAGVAGVAGTAVVLNRLSPGPGARVVREVFDRDSAKATERAEALRPDDVVVVEGIGYRDGDTSALLDLHRPASGEGPFPVVVWVHGGGYVSGSRRDVGVFYSLLAQRGFAVAAVDYRLAPRAAYPAPVLDVTAAVQHLVEHADELGLDPHRVVLAGDSAGAQVVSQLAALATNPDYAAAAALDTALPADSLRGVVLFCGFYDLVEFAERGRLSGVAFLRWGVGTILHAYTGVRSPTTEQLRLMSASEHATSSYPPAFVTGGDADPLTDIHSRTFADRLANLGVPVTRLFFPPGTGLGHEYQRDLDRPETQQAIDAVAEFVGRVTA